MYFRGMVVESYLNGRGAAVICKEMIYAFLLKVHVDTK